jgi:hypothetical protein
VLVSKWHWTNPVLSFLVSRIQMASSWSGEYIFILLHPEHGTSLAIQNNVLHILESKEEFKASGVIGIC